ncbi:ABC transporter substrate-binding protein [Xylella fastidiosa subsp. multiplex]|uniref:ABC transporter substrate-binding protein n=1 Tax=Xylella fastidiosa TaxID=2371 RepID=UPI0005720746|nr:ABC transporter substrate-binding protein [Xylella fastidiosa]MDD0909340.1 ABC transporter substrate-binding protein [Xylella fastidiosa subsp. multiplex]MDS9989362.1 extracellular solute-binding protein [Xylella fastidiosa]UIT48891.1 ABC transporter substrate-binding protein [Xylella fastidiosa subsp. multiplex]
MIRVAVLLLLLTCHFMVWAHPGEIRHFSTKGPVTAQLRIQGANDVERFAVVIADYQRLHPGSEVIYEEQIASQIYHRYLHPASSQPPPDLLISASMDLQIKLANDGHALAYRSSRTRALPTWAQWRYEVFGIGYEPAVIVYNTRRLPSPQVPRTRHQLLALLRAPEAPLRGQIGTYDVERSAVGYLLSTQDAQLGSIAGALWEAMGEDRVQLEAGTGALLDRVASGELLLAYNVLGSYAQARVDAGVPLGIVQPEDYTLLALRTAVIPRGGVHVSEAQHFLDYLLSERGQRVLSHEVRLMPVLPGSDRIVSMFRPIALGPGLLVYLDTLKRRQFLYTWRSSMLPPR